MRRCHGQAQANRLKHCGNFGKAQILQGSLLKLVDRLTRKPGQLSQPTLGQANVFAALTCSLIAVPPEWK